MLNTKKILTIAILSAISLNTFASEVSTGAVTSTGAQTSSGEVVQTLDVASLESTSISWVEAIDAQTLTVRLSSNLSGISPDSEAKILEDVKVLEAVKDLDNAKKIKLSLDTDLIDGKNYSIISVSEGLDTSIDFNLSWDKTKIVNSALVPEETWIEYISVVDSKTVEVYLNKDSSLEKYEFKTFKELNVDSMFLDTTNLNLKLTDTLVSNKDYILILTLKDLENKDIEVDNSLFDFVTPTFAAPAVEDFLAAWELTSSWPVVTDATQSGETVEEVAMNATQTPPTWTETNVLLFLTFILTLSIFLAKRKSLKM